MKKFLKYVTIIGCILVLVGTGVATAAFSLGANPIHVFDDWEDRFDHYFDDDPFISPTQVIEGTIVPHLNETVIPGPEESLAVPSTESFELVYEEVTDLEIRIKGGEVVLEPQADATHLAVLTTSGKAEHVTFNNLDRYKKLDILAEKNEEYLIRIPADWVLSELEVHCAGGDFEGYEVHTRDAELTVSGGTIMIHQVGGKETSMDCAGGEIEWSGSGELSRDIDVECAGGEVLLTLDEGVDPDKVGYEFDYAGGEIEFFGVNYNGLGSLERRAADGMPHLELDAAGGVIVVQ